MKRMISLVCALVMVPVLAAAQPSTPEQWYKEGETQYNLGNFDKAADAFKQGYALEPADAKKPAYLYNVAQAYRQGKKCKDAAFFYKRYLSLKDADIAKPLKPEKKSEIEGWIAELEALLERVDGLVEVAQVVLSLAFLVPLLWSGRLRRCQHRHHHQRAHE